jgi:hypothetical protein
VRAWHDGSKPPPAAKVKPGLAARGKGEGDDVRAGHDRLVEIHSFHGASVRSIVAINTDLASN